MDNPALEVMRRRYSCRSYVAKTVDERDRAALVRRLEALGPGPFGAPVRFLLEAATPGDERALKGLGTYGNIRDPRAAGRREEGR